MLLRICTMKLLTFHSLQQSPNTILTIVFVFIYLFSFWYISNINYMWLSNFQSFFISIFFDNTKGDWQKLQKFCTMVFHWLFLPSALTLWPEELIFFLYIDHIYILYYMPMIYQCRKLLLKVSKRCSVDKHINLAKLPFDLSLKKNKNKKSSLNFSDKLFQFKKDNFLF